MIRSLSSQDLVRAEKWCDFINSLVEEKAQVLENKKQSLAEAREELRKKLQEIKKGKDVFLLAEDDGKIVGRAEIYSLKGCLDHLAEIRLAIRNGYRGIGLGSFLMKKILASAKKLKPKPKFARLSLFETNKPAFHLYRKFGFKEVGRVKKQCQFKGRLVGEIVMLLEI